MHGSSQGNVVHLSPLVFVPSGKNDARLQAVLVLVAQILEESSRRANIRGLAMLHTSNPTSGPAKLQQNSMQNQNN